MRKDFKNGTEKGKNMSAFLTNESRYLVNRHEARAHFHPDFGDYLSDPLVIFALSVYLSQYASSSNVLKFTVDKVTKLITLDVIIELKLTDRLDLQKDRFNQKFRSLLFALYDVYIQRKFPNHGHCTACGFVDVCPDAKDFLISNYMYNAYKESFISPYQYSCITLPKLTSRG